MAYIEGHARDQALLLPASVEDYVAGHKVHLRARNEIAAFVPGRPSFR